MAKVPKLDDDIEAGRIFLQDINAVMFDCDGVLWTGQSVVEGAVDVLNKLRSLGKKIILVTNNSRRGRNEFWKKIKGFGFEVEKNEAFCTPTIAALYLKNILNFKKKVYVIGEESLISELNATGITTTGAQEVKIDADIKSKNMLEELDFSLDPDVGAVVVGYDRFFNLKKCNTALQYLRKPELHFIATNTDPSFPVGGGLVAPGTGAVIAAIKTCAGREPCVLGKPEKPMFEAIQEVHKLDPSRTLMVGDRLETDILFGKNNGLKTLAVLTGVANKESLERICAEGLDSLIPDYYLDSIGDLQTML